MAIWTKSKESTTTTSPHDEGFSLIELMVTILVIGVLMAIAFPVFMTVRKQSADKSAQSSARTALVAAKAHQLDKSDYTSVAEADLVAAEPTLTYRQGTSSFSNGSRIVAYHNTTDSFALAVWSPSGFCFRLYESTTQAATSSKTQQAALLCTPTTIAAGSTW